MLFVSPIIIFHHLEKEKDNNKLFSLGAQPKQLPFWPKTAQGACMSLMCCRLTAHKSKTLNIASAQS